MIFQHATMVHQRSAAARQRRALSFVSPKVIERSQLLMFQPLAKCLRLSSRFQWNADAPPFVPYTGASHSLGDSSVALVEPKHATIEEETYSSVELHLDSFLFTLGPDDIQSAQGAPRSDILVNTSEPLPQTESSADADILFEVLIGTAPLVNFIGTLVSDCRANVATLLAGSDDLEPDYLFTYGDNFYDHCIYDIVNHGTFRALSRILEACSQVSSLLADLRYPGTPIVDIQFGPHDGHPLDQPCNVRLTLEEACLGDARNPAAEDGETRACADIPPSQFFNFGAADAIALKVRDAFKGLLQACIQDAQARTAGPDPECFRSNNFVPNTYTLSRARGPTSCLMCSINLNSGARCFALDRHAGQQAAYMCFKCKARSKGKGKGKT